jgi:hypothetical protein
MQQVERQDGLPEWEPLVLMRQPQFLCYQGLLAQKVWESELSNYHHYFCR